MRKSLQHHHQKEFMSRQFDKLYDSLQSYVRARELAYTSAPVKRLATFEAIGQIKRQLDFHRFSSHEAVCQMVLKLEWQIRALIPNQNSRYYQGTFKKTEAMLNYAKSYLNK